MSKKLEELFNLPSAEEDAEMDQEIEEMFTGSVDDELTNINQSRNMLADVSSAIDKIDAALPTVRDLEASDREMDDLARLATDNFEHLMELGMSVDSRFSGTIFQTAGTLLGHAITAKQAKLDKKLKMVDLQLKKANLDLNSKKEERLASQAQASGDDAIEAQGHVLDRNDIINAILNRKNDE